ncbi:hypothetical protein EV2_022452 [Malus domestica]
MRACSMCYSKSLRRNEGMLMCYSNLQVPNWSPITFSRLASLGRSTLATLSKSPLKCFRSIQYSDAHSSCSFEIPPDWLYLDSGHPGSGMS